MDGHNQYILYAHVPILEEAPAGLSLALVDTPGFGEANVDHVALLTDTLFNTSSAYLYIMDGRQMGDATDAENVKRLYRKDRGKAGPQDVCVFWCMRLDVCNS